VFKDDSNFFNLGGVFSSFSNFFHGVLDAWPSVGVTFLSIRLILPLEAQSISSWLSGFFSRLGQEAIGRDDLDLDSIPPVVYGG
jgi:hypothetical protein